jgi:hypothetical protein
VSFAFAGNRRPIGPCKGETGEHLLFAFLTTAPGDMVHPVLSKAMPVILAGNACDIWLEADVGNGAKVTTGLAGGSPGRGRDRTAPGHHTCGSCLIRPLDGCRRRQGLS